MSARGGAKVWTIKLKDGSALKLTASAGPTKPSKRPRNGEAAEYRGLAADGAAAFFKKDMML